ncbi:MAG: 3-hydroxyacyl-ACP dehydratase FabZ family protein [Phycisphaerae bacterium]
MPPSQLLDLSQIDLTKTLVDEAGIYEKMPHRFEFQLLDGVCHADAETKSIVTYCDVTNQDWWVRGHVPGRPLLPGVLMLEMAAQTCALMVKLWTDYEGFIGFGGVNNCKFRDSISPEPKARLYVMGKTTDLRRRRIVADTQGMVDGRMIFEAEITGLTMG